MLCIFCLEDRPSTLEHVFPLAIGGTITTDRVCGDCNSILGTRVDGALSDFFPIRMRRARLGLAGNSGTPPMWYELLEGESSVIGQAASRVRVSFSEATGGLDTRQLYHAADVESPDGSKFRQITLDARDIDQIPKIIQRERKRRGLPPLRDEELAIAAANYTVKVVEKPVIAHPINVSFEYLRHALIKIAYELSFIWFGEAYLTDPIAVELRKAICDADPASTDNIPCYVGDVGNCVPFKFWIPHENHHLAYANIARDQKVVLCVRIFDIFAAAVTVSHEPGRYFSQAADRKKLRFIAMDSLTGRTIDTSFDEESRRLARERCAKGAAPPFLDPLVSPTGSG